MVLKYVHNYIGTNEATMRIYSEVGGLLGVNGIDFCNEMQHLINIGVTSINLRINSPGGNVLDGQTIISCIRDAQNNGITVNTYVDYMAASIAGVIAMYGNKRYIVSNGLFMMHDPSGGGNDAKGKEVLNKIKETLAEQLSKSSGKELTEVMDMMTVETWLNAKDAVTSGFFDDTFESIVKVKNVSTDNYLKLFEVSNNLLTKKDKKMIEVLNKLNLSDKAEEKEIIQAIEKIENEKKTLEESKASFEKEVEDLHKELDELKVKIQEKTEQEAKVLVENAIKDGKIKADAFDVIFEQAKNNFDSVKNMLDAVTAQDYHGFRNAVKPTEQADDRASWTLNDWKKNDAAGLLKMEKEDKEKFNNLFKQL